MKVQCPPSPGAAQRLSPRQVYAGISETVCALDEGGRILYISPSCHRLFAKEAGELLHTLLQPLLSEPSAASLNRFLAARSAEPSETELSLLRPDGTVHPIILTARWDGAGPCFYCVLRDGSNHRTLVQRLQKAQQLARVANFEFDHVKKSYTYLSDTMYELFGVEYTTRFTPQVFFNFVHPEDRARVEANLEDPSQYGISTCEYRIIRPDGRIVHLLRNRELLLDAEGRKLRTVGTLVDITERRMEEAELRKLSLIARETDNAVILQDTHRNVLWVNDAFLRHTGYTIEDCIGKKIQQICDGPATDPDILRYVQQQMERNLPFRIEALNYKKNGETYWVDISCQPLYNDKGEVYQYFSIATDITERKLLEKQLQREQRNRSIQVAAATLRAQEAERSVVSQELHDNVNQVLTTVKLYTEMCRDGIGHREEMLDKSVRLLQDSINEIRSLSKRLSAPSLGKIRLADSVKELVEAVAATDRFAIELLAGPIRDTDFSQEVHLAVYRILQEHLTNILKHADATRVEVRFDHLMGGLHLQVSDNGKGFDPAVRSSGIGIANMITRAETLQGTLKIESAPGAGCRLLLSIPA